MDGSSPGSSVHGIFQERILEQSVISYSRGSPQSKVQTHISCVFCIDRYILDHGATQEAQCVPKFISTQNLRL